MTTSRDDFDGEIDVSIVVPVFNEEDGLGELYRRLKAMLTAEGWRHEIILVNDGSRDRSWERIVALADSDRAVKAVNLSRNFGHQIAITAGIDLSRGSAVVVMDADLQDPPALVPVLHAKFREGYDVVYAQRRSRDGETWFKRATAALFYRLIRRMTTLEIPMDTGDFRLMSRRVVADLKEMNERSRFVRGLVTWVGYNQIAVPYDRDRRYGGETKFSLAKMITFAIDGITGFSSQPLRLASHVGLLCSIVSVVLTVVLATYKLAGGAGLVQGWTSLAVAVLFLGGLQLLAIGILGEYVGRIHEESKQRPLYLLRDHRNLATPLGPRDRRQSD
jgi:dolichol-phosphate mannosyltransferase